jgi:hypothetical protein
MPGAPFDRLFFPQSDDMSNPTVATTPRDAFSQEFEAVRRSLRVLQRAVDAPGFAPVDTVALDADPTSPDAGAFAVAAWFLGTKGENAEEFEKLVVEAIRDHVHWRRNFHPADPTFITEETKAHPAYRHAMGTLKDAYLELLGQLKRSVPFFSMRYQGHMNWDLTLPGMLGYFATMLYNPNNVAFEGSVATTILEILVGDDLCRMLGYKVPEASPLPTEVATAAVAPADTGVERLISNWNRLTERQRGKLLAVAGIRRNGHGPDHEPGVVDVALRSEADPAIRPWGHITCDGTVANIEAIWSARNLRFYPIAIRAALNGAKNRESPEVAPLASAVGLEVTTCDGKRGRLIDLNNWQALNLTADETLGLVGRLQNEYRIGRDQITAAISQYNVQNLGLAEFTRRYFDEIGLPVVTVPGTKHYSFPKAAAILGLGSNQLIDVAVDLDGRQDLLKLREILDGCLNAHKPVIAVVSVMGTTEESAVDPLDDILSLREEYRAKGLDFTVHADAAWGGYHASLLHEPGALGSLPIPGFAPPQPAPELTLNVHTSRQYRALARADSITVDPHKSGYIPYPAGALCYRNSATRDLVTFSAPVIFRGDAEPTVGIYGIEGSKPGAAAAAVYLAHRVIRPDKGGYGRIIGQALYSCRRFYARLLGMARPGDPFVVVPVPRLPAERAGLSADKVEAQRVLVAERIGRATNDEIRSDPEALELLKEIGPDENILGYAFTVNGTQGPLQPTLATVNALNKAVYEQLSIDPGKDIYGYDMLVSTTDLARDNYKDAFIDDYKRRLGITDAPAKGDTITILRSVVMDPWVTDTTRGSFLDVLELELRKAVLKAIESIQPSQTRGY